MAARSDSPEHIVLIVSILTLSRFRARKEAFAPVAVSNTHGGAPAPRPAGGRELISLTAAHDNVTPHVPVRQWVLPESFA